MPYVHMYKSMMMLKNIKTNKKNVTNNNDNACVCLEEAKDGTKKN